MLTCRPRGNLLKQTSGSMMMITLKSEFVVDTALHSARTRASIGVDICVLLGPSGLPATHIFAKQNLARARVSRVVGTSYKFAMEKSAKRIAGSWHLQCSRHGKLRCRRRRCRRVAWASRWIDLFLSSFGAPSPSRAPSSSSHLSN